jgi:hypothetical protein
MLAQREPRKGLSAVEAVRVVRPNCQYEHTEYFICILRNWSKAVPERTFGHWIFE